jgi:D-glycero-D-manno-heptose 1,7-bisphosphate phosphatase
MKKAIFLDRDGTINVEKGYLYKQADFEFIPKVVEALKIINKLGYIIVVVSNQSGIARGYYLKEDVERLHSFIDELLSPDKLTIAKYYYCPHHPSITGLCECRKPANGMLKLAAKEFDIDLENSYMVGDKVTDMQAGYAAGCKCVMVRTGYGQSEIMENKQNISFEICSDLYQFALRLLNEARN